MLVVGPFDPCTQTLFFANLLSFTNTISATEDHINQPSTSEGVTATRSSATTSMATVTTTPGNVTTPTQPHLIYFLLCVPFLEPEHEKVIAPVVIGIVLPVIVLAVLVTVLPIAIICYRRRRKENMMVRIGSSVVHTMLIALCK